MTHQPPKPPFLSLRLILLALLLVLLIGVGWQWNQHPPISSDFASAVTVKPPPLLHTPAPSPYDVYEEQAPPTPPVPKQKSHTPASGPARIAVIIDDMGISHLQSDLVLALPSTVTLSFLPYGRATSAVAESAHTKGFEVMLHMPMQPSGHADPGPNALAAGLSAETVATRLKAAFARVPHAVGVNNHMGSEATADATLMHDFMQALAPMKRFFVDSYTSADSVAYATAAGLGIPAARRDVFIDNDPSAGAIMAQLHHAEGIARKHGQAIVIGHPYPSTIAALRQWLPTLEQQGMKVVKVSELLKEP